jgi:hypothetical protein
MKINIHNYKEAEAKVDWNSASAALGTGKAFTQKGIGSYEKAPAIKTAIDKYFLLLENTLARTQAPAKKKSSAVPKKASPVTPRKATAKASNEEVTTTVVEHIPTDIALVRKFTNLHGKTKNYDQILSIWRAFEKAVVERKVTKASPYQAEIKYMKDSLTGALRVAKEHKTIDLAIPAERYRKFKVIADSVERSVGVSLLLEFINISGRLRMQERAAKLQARIRKALGAGQLKGDRYLDEVKSALKDLDAFVGSKKTRIEMNDYYLSGIGEIALHGCKCRESLSGFSRGQNAVILKLIQEKAKNFTAPELNRIFADTVAPSICRLIVRRLVDTGQLTMRMIRNPAMPKSSAALSGAPDEPAKTGTYNFDTAVMDMRLRSAARQMPVDNSNRPMAGFSGLDNAPTSFAYSGEVKIISASDLVKQKFSTIGLSGKYLKLIGDPEPGFSMIIFGKPKQGKSTFAIDFAKELTRLGKVLYVAFEEGQGYTLRDKVIRNEADVPGLDFANKLPPTLSGYKYTFMDSVTDAGISEVSFNALVKANKAREIATIGVLHATKAGSFRGGLTYAHTVDIVIRVENGTAYAQGRYAPPGEISISAIS